MDRFKFFVLILAPGLIFLSGGCGQVDKSHPVIEAQRLQYPAMEMQDWYKLIHQAAMGNRHLGVEDSLIYNYLLHELNSIEANPEEPLIEFISADSQVVRLNLRPFKANGGNPDQLFAAMQETWNTVIPSPELLEEYALQVDALAKTGEVPFTPESWQQFVSEKKTAGFPEVHHSDVYTSNYAPAYRVLLATSIPE